MYFAVRASRGLKLLFLLCLAGSASQNNQKLCVIVVAGFGEMARIYVPPPVPSFTLMARSAALFLLFHPPLHPALYQSDKVGAACSYRAL